MNIQAHHTNPMTRARLPQSTPKSTSESPTPTETFERSSASSEDSGLKRFGDLALATAAGAGAGIAAGALPALSIIGIAIAPFTMIAGAVVGAGTALSMEALNPGQISDMAREAF